MIEQVKEFIGGLLRGLASDMPLRSRLIFCIDAAQIAHKIRLKAVFIHQNPFILRAQRIDFGIMRGIVCLYIRLCDGGMFGKFRLRI